MAITVILEIEDTGIVSFANAQTRGRKLEAVLLEFMTKGATLAGYTTPQK